MPIFDSDGVSIFYQSTGDGFPLIWSHEFAGSYESWEQQVRYFSHRYRVITYNDRGYPPSDVPSDPEAYAQEITIEDLRRLMDHLGLDQAYIGGLSMGGNVALNFALRYPERCKAIIVASAGSGTTHNEAFRSGGEAMAARLLAEGTPPVMKDYGSGPTRVQLQRKDPRGYEEFMRLLFGHHARGSAYTFRGVQLRRPTVDQLIPQMNQLQVPTLIMIGDEDDPCVEPSIMMKRAIPRSGLAVLPQCGHAINLEEPELFNRLVSDFLASVEAGKWADHPLGDTPYSTGSR